MRTPVLQILTKIHRWLGIAGGFLFVLWFVSGVVMMYARMPRLDPLDRLARLGPLDLSDARIGPGEAAALAGLALTGPGSAATIDRLRIGMLGARPVYRFQQNGQWNVVFADSGARMLGLTENQALELARAFAPEASSTLTYDRYLNRPDQWTLQFGPLLPLHRIALRDSHHTELYVSDRLGEVVLTGTRSERVWAYLGAVVHWLYFTPFRARSGLWLQTVLWLSIFGCLLTLSGLWVGVWRLLQAKSSPYRGLMRWHHYAGLVFGLVTFTWILSGCLSLEPWAWTSSTLPSKQQQEAVAGGPLQVQTVGLKELEEAASLANASFAAKELELTRFQGKPLLLAHRPPPAPGIKSLRADGPTAFLSLLQPAESMVITPGPPASVVARFSEEVLVEAAGSAMPSSSIASVEWLEEYDSYYYDRTKTLPLPVLKLRFDDRSATWLYLDPQRAMILHREQRSSRINRWLYRGLHRLDFPWLYQRRPLWDAVVILLLLGGILLSTSSLLPGLKRVKQHAQRLFR